MRRPIACLVLACAASGSAAARVAVSEPGMAPMTIGSDALRSLPAATVDVASHGRVVRYAGPRLWDVLAKAGAVDGTPDRRLHETLTVTGADGYAAPLALAEIDPAFEGKDVILARTRDGAALARPRLVVPRDRHPGRDVRDVERIAIAAGS